MISVISIVGMFFSLIVCIVITIGLYLALRKNLELKIVPALVGAAAFVVFAMVLEQLLHSIVLTGAPDGSIALMESPLLYVLYGIFAAGIFEESARLLSFALLKRKFAGVATAISYGIGHGGIEALLIVALAMVNNIAVSLIANSGMAGLMGDAPEMAAAVARLAGTAPSMFFIGGIERITAVALHISLSVIVWHSINTKGRIWLYPLAIILHALANVSAAMYQAGLISNIWIVEASTGMVVAAVVLFALIAHRKRTPV